MADSDNAKEKPITLRKIKENLKDYSLSKLISLTFVLIYYLDNLVKEKIILRKPLKNMRKR